MDKDEDEDEDDSGEDGRGKKRTDEDSDRIWIEACGVLWCVVRCKLPACSQCIKRVVKTRRDDGAMRSDAEVKRN